MGLRGLNGRSLMLFFWCFSFTGVFMLSLRKAGLGRGALVSYFPQKCCLVEKDKFPASKATNEKILHSDFNLRCGSGICIALLFSVLTLVAVPPEAQGQVATRVSTGSSVGSATYAEHTGWNTGSYLLSGYGLYYANVLNGNNPWTVRYVQGTRANNYLWARANKLTLD